MTDQFLCPDCGLAFEYHHHLYDHRKTAGGVAQCANERARKLEERMRELEAMVATLAGEGR